MAFKQFNPRTIVLLLMMIVVAILRLLTHFSDHLNSFSNFTPIGAMALFGGASFKGKLKPFLFPLFTLFLSDVVLSFTIYTDFRSGLLYTGWYWTYAAFALMVLVGKFFLKNENVKNVMIGAIVTTVIHWLVSDIGGCLMEKTTEAILSLYVKRLITAIPYELYFFAGTLIYAVLMFGIFQWLQRKYPDISLVKNEKFMAA
jgi:hypothetical protein